MLPFGINAIAAYALHEVAWALLGWDLLQQPYHDLVPSVGTAACRIRAGGLYPGLHLAVHVLSVAQELAGPDLVGHGQRRALEVDRVRPGGNGEGAGLDDALHLRVPQRQIVGLSSKRDRPALAGLQRHALEPLQLDHRPGDRRLIVVDVELHDLVAGAAAGVRDVDARPAPSGWRAMPASASRGAEMSKLV